jgi:hypothetical protein
LEVITAFEPTGVVVLVVNKKYKNFEWLQEISVIHVQK